MADRYVATGSQDVTTASPGDTSLAVLASASTRGRIYEFILTAGGTPADNAIQWLARRLTAVGIEGAGVVPEQLDSDAPAAQLDGAENHTTEPTYTAATELFDQIINQRTAFTWMAYPASEILVPATALNGVGFTAFHASYTGSAEVTAYWVE